MPATRTIALENPVKLFNDSFAVVELREPTGGEYLALGLPTTTYRMGATVSEHDLPDVITGYLARCIINVPEIGAHHRAFLGGLSLRDGIRLREAMVEFFNAAYRSLRAADGLAAAAEAEASASAAGLP